MRESKTPADQTPGNMLPRPLKVSVELPERYDCVAIIRRMGRTMLEHCQTNAHDVDETETVIGELCGNAARHARSECGWYSCSIEHHGSHVIVTVIDQGQGFDPDTPVPAGMVHREDDGSERHGGFGLPLVRVLTDHIHFSLTEPQGTTVCVKKRLSKPQKPSLLFERRS